MNHLEQLIAEWLEWKKYIVKTNVRVGRRKGTAKTHGGGYEGELDIVGYYPFKPKHILHVEPSITSKSLSEVDARFKKKFKNGQKYILSEVFPWVKKTTPIEQWAVIMASCGKSKPLGGAQVLRVHNIYRKIARCIQEEATNNKGRKTQSTIPENYPLLRTIQHMLEYAVGGELKTTDEEVSTSALASSIQWPRTGGRK